VQADAHGDTGTESFLKRSSLCMPQTDWLIAIRNLRSTLSVTPCLRGC